LRHLLELAREVAQREMWSNGNTKLFNEYTELFNKQPVQVSDITRYIYHPLSPLHPLKNEKKIHDNSPWEREDSCRILHPGGTMSNRCIKYQSITELNRGWTSVCACVRVCVSGVWVYVKPIFRDWSSREQSGAHTQMTPQLNPVEVICSLQCSYLHLEVCARVYMCVCCGEKRGPFTDHWC